MVGPALSGTKTAVAATSGIDGTDSVQSVNPAELISSGASPSLSGDGGQSKGRTDATLFSHSGGIVSESMRTAAIAAAAATATGPPPHYTQPRSWELEHYPALQANCDLERSASDSLAQGGAHPLPHAGLAEHSQQRTPGIATAFPVHLMTSATSADARSVAANSSRGPHASSPSPSPGTPPPQTSHFHLNLVSESSVLACPELGPASSARFGPIRVYICVYYDRGCGGGAPAGQWGSGYPFGGLRFPRSPRPSSGCLRPPPPRCRACTGSSLTWSATPCWPVRKRGLSFAT
jgi:hypothetical protein